MRAQGTSFYHKPLLWVLPMLVMLALFYVYPLFDVIRLSFTDSSILRDDYTYTLKSYIRVLQDENFHRSFWITLIFVSVNVTFQIGLGMFIAIVINTAIKRGLWGTILTRTIVLTAWMIPGVLVGIVWKMILSSSSIGILNYFFELVGIGRVPFLVEPAIALACIIGANIWRGTAFSMILQFAGLQRIPDELYEAAEVDGASSYQRFMYVTLPQLRPIVFVNLVLITIYSFNTFDMVVSLTNGGPARTTEVMTLAAYQQVFSFFDLGRGAAIAVILLFINLTMAIVYYKFVLAGRETTD